MGALLLTLTGGISPPSWGEGPGVLTFAGKANVLIGAVLTGAVSLIEHTTGWTGICSECGQLLGKWFVAL